MKIRTLMGMGWLVVLTLCALPVAYAQQGLADSEDMMGSFESGRGMDMEESSAPREAIVKPQVSFSLDKERDPMLSPDDLLLIKHREQQRMAAEAAERRRQAEAERKRLAEEERRRQWELALIKDPTIVIRNQIHISGLIDKEVLIDGKLYTVGHTYKGAKIVAVGPDSVTFVYKGHRFVKKVNI